MKVGERRRERWESGWGEGGARARDSEGRGSRDGQPPPLQAGCRGDVTTLPAGGGTSVFFPPGLLLSFWHPKRVE